MLNFLKDKKWAFKLSLALLCLLFSFIFISFFFNHSLLTVFFARDFARAADYFSAPFYFGPETSGGGFLWGPFYYLILNFFFKWGLSWDGLNFIRISLFALSLFFIGRVLYQKMKHGFWTSLVFLFSILFFKPFLDIVFYDYNASLATGMIFLIIGYFLNLSQKISAKVIIAFLILISLLLQIHMVIFIWGILLVLAIDDHWKKKLQYLLIFFCAVALFSSPYWLYSQFAIKIDGFNYLFVPEVIRAKFDSIKNIFNYLVYIYHDRNLFFKNIQMMFSGGSFFSLIVICWGAWFVFFRLKKDTFLNRLTFYHAIYGLISMCLFIEETRYYIMFLPLLFVFGANSIVDLISKKIKPIRCHYQTLFLYGPFLFGIVFLFIWRDNAKTFFEEENNHFTYEFRRHFCNDFIKARHYSSSELRKHLYQVNISSESVLFDPLDKVPCSEISSGPIRENFIIVRDNIDYIPFLPQEIQKLYQKKSLEFIPVYSYDRYRVIEMRLLNKEKNYGLPHHISNMGYPYDDLEKNFKKIDSSSWEHEFDLIGVMTDDRCRNNGEKNCRSELKLWKNKNDSHHLRIILNSPPLSVPFVLYQLNNTQFWEDVQLNLTCDGSVKKVMLLSKIGSTWENLHNSFLAPFVMDIQNPCMESIHKSELEIKKITLSDGTYPFPYDGISDEYLPFLLDDLEKNKWKVFYNTKISFH